MKCLTCPKDAVARGYCPVCYIRARREGLPKLPRIIPPCSVPGCGKPHTAKGFCPKHYREVYPEKKKPKTKEQLWRQVLRDRANPERKRERNKAYRDANKEKKRLADIAYRKANPDKSRAKTARYRTALAGTRGSYTVEEWQDLLAFYGHRCRRCAKGANETVLTADHIYPVSRGGTSYIWNIQPLCKSCNSWKKDRVFLDM